MNAAKRTAKLRLVRGAMVAHAYRVNANKPAYLRDHFVRRALEALAVRMADVNRRRRYRGAALRALAHQVGVTRRSVQWAPIVSRVVHALRAPVAADASARTRGMTNFPGEGDAPILQART